MPGMYYNPYFPGMQIAMPKPMTAGQIEFMDGTEATYEQMARDLVIFLQLFPNRAQTITQCILSVINGDDYRYRRPHLKQ
jgi:cytochrome c1